MNTFPYMTDQLLIGECNRCWCFEGVDKDGPICRSTQRPVTGVCVKGRTSHAQEAPLKAPKDNKKAGSKIISHRFKI